LGPGTVLPSDERKGQRLAEWMRRTMRGRDKAG